MFTFNSSVYPPSPLPDLFSAAPPPSSTGVPIASIIAVGFFATSLVLTIYYLVVVRFWLNNHQRQAQNSYMPPIFFTYETEGRGVDSSLINSIPVVIFQKGEDGQKMKSLSVHECAVCLADFQEKESIKVLPSCSHAFHIDCIDTWLQFNVNCPMCRAVVSSSSLIQKPDDDIEFQTQIDLRGEGDDQHEGDIAHRNENGVRRSFSMDFFSERRIKRGETSTSNGAVVNGDTSGRFMRLVHSFRLGRSSRSAVLPIQMDP